MKKIFSEVSCNNVLGTLGLYSMVIFSNIPQMQSWIIQMVIGV